LTNSWRCCIYADPSIHNNVITEHIASKASGSSGARLFLAYATCTAAISGN
jgi:hypothetical protein